MAIDTLARGMAANASGGGGGGVDVGIEAGVGIRFGGTDPVEIINTGVTAVTTPGSSGADVDAPLGSVKVSNPGALNSADRVHYVVPKGLDNAAFKDVDTEINSSVATSTNLPTTKAVYDELEKKLEADLDTTAFTNDNDHVPSSKLVKEKLDDKLEDSLTINGVSYDSTNDSYTLDGDDIDLTGYTQISSGAEEDVAATDSVNDAVAKIEYKADNRIPTDNIDADFPVTPSADHVLASTVASATFQGTGTVGVSPKKGLVPAPNTTSGTETRYLKADGTWATPPNSEYSEGTGIDIDNAGVITNTGVTHIENSDPADDNVGNGTFKVVENGTAKWIAIKGLDDAAYMDVVTSIPATPLDTDLPTSQAVAKYVDDAIDALPKPMVFKGGITLTADSTDTTLCSLTLPSGITTIKEGYTFKVVAIASSPVYTGNIKVGDTLYANKDNAKTTADWVVDTDWTITPSGDEPSGTVTEVTASDGIIAYDNATHGSSISDNGNIKLALVTNHTTTANAGDASNTADRSYPLALDGNGKLATNVPWTDTTYEFADSYNASTNKGATVATVTNAIGELDVSGTNAFGAGKTISSWSETDGKVNITSQDISITGSQISDIDTTMPATADDTKVPSTKLVKTQLSGKQDTLAFDGTYNASTNKAATVSTVTNAINALDVAAVPVGATKTLTSISQTDGKISATATDIQSASTSQKGLVQLNNTLTSTSTTQAATANAVKAVNDKAETNQTNILSVRDATEELVDKGAKNKLDEWNEILKNHTPSGNTVIVNGITYTYANGSITMSGTATENSYLFIITNTMMFSSDTPLVIAWRRKDVSNATITIQYLDDSPIISTDDVIIVPSGKIGMSTLFLTVPTGTTVSGSIDLMICTKAEYDISSNYVPFALSNPILTPALIECVDNGAKNEFNPEKEILYGYVTDGNGYAFKSVIHDTRTVLTFVLLAYNNDTFVRELNSADIISTGLFSFTFVKGSDFNSLRFGHSGTVQDIKIYVDVSDLEDGETYVLSFNTTAIDPTVLIAWNSTMICTKAKWDVSHKFEPYALPNDELTKLEAEDRAALTEVVDAGAKNLWDFANANITAGGGADRITYVKTADSLTITAVSTWAFVSYDIALKKGTYYFYGLISGLTGTDSKCVQIRVNGYQGTVIKRIDITANGAISDSFVVDTDRTITISLYASEGEYTSSAFTISNLMICTEAAWKVSQSFASFALPNTDLTVLEAEDRAALAEVVDSGAKNLFNIFTSSEHVDSTITRTINSNGTVTVSNDGTNTGVAVLTYKVSLVANTQYIISGCPSGGSDSSYSLSIRTTNSQPIPYAVDYGSGSEVFTVSSTGVYLVYLRVAAGYAFSNKIFKPMICTEADWKISQNFAPHALPNTVLTRMVNDLQKKAVKVYTYHVNPNESDPEDAVTYLDDATGLTPAKMGASSFSYGSWANAWFLPRPCMLKSDGTVAYYLNPNDYSKKTDGTASDIADANFDGNVMLEFPKIWVKRVNDGNGARTVSIAPVNVDGTYKCWSNINAEDKEVDHFYLPAYNGTIHSSKMRSLSGVTLNTTYAPNYTRAQEVTAATANNPTGKNLWYTETWADFCLIYDLLYLMGKSLDVQRTFGQGLSSGAETAMRAYVTGTHNDKGLFYGDVSGTSTAVKVLGMENLWGCRWHGVAGLINDNGTLKVKMTYGVADGSTTVGYNTTGSGYLNYGSTYGTNGFVKKMQADNTMGYKIIETAGTDATYYCDYYYVNNSQSNYALLGGASDHGAGCGFYVILSYGAAHAIWYVGGSLSCRP